MTGHRQGTDGRSLDGAASELEHADTAGELEHADTAAKPAEIAATRTGEVHASSPAQREPVSLAEGGKVDRFTVIDKLGEGGMGVVLAAYDPLLDRRIALKLLRPGSLGSQLARKRMIREAQAMAQLSHPNVLPIFDAGVVHDQVFIAMEFVDGQNLMQWAGLAKRSWREVLEVYIRAGRGLEAAHDAGLVHRDFKPENVLIDDKDRVRVTDFGLVSAVSKAGPGTGHGESRSRGESEHTGPGDSLTATGTIMGTPIYMAPEQHLGQATDARSDQFGFCVALHEALYGQRPFDGSTIAELAANVVAGRLAARPADADVPAWVGDCLRRGLRRDQDDRYPTMTELLAALERDPARARRRALALGGTGILIALLAALAVFGLTRDRSAVAQQCSNPRHYLEGVWDEDIKRAVHSAFLAVKTPHAEVTFRSVQSRLDRYAEEWAAMHTDACEATHVRAEQSPGLLDLRMMCLSERLTGLDALVELLASGDETVLRNAVSATAALAPLADCADERLLRSRLPLPADPGKRLAIAGRKTTLARSAALHDSGKYDEGLELATELLENGHELDYAPISARTLFLLATFHRKLARPERAEAALILALEAAGRGREAVLAAEIWIERIRVLTELGRFDDALELREVARTAVNLVGNRPRLVASLLEAMASLHAERGDYARAIELREKALAGIRTVSEPDTPEQARKMNDLANVYNRAGDFDRALELNEAVLPILEQALGPDHPTVAAALSSLGATLENLARYEDSWSARTRARRILEDALGSTNVGVARALEEQARTRHAQGMYDEAIELVKQALDTLAAVGGDMRRDEALSRQFLATVLRDRGDYQQALAENQRVLTLRAEIAGTDHRDYAADLDEVAITLGRLRRHQEALDTHLQALDIYQRRLGDNHVALGNTLTDIGRTWYILGQAERAIAPLERAVLVFASNRGDPAAAARARIALAYALWTSGKDRKRALEVGVQARDALVDATDERQRHLLSTITTWLRKRGVE